MFEFWMQFSLKFVPKAPIDNNTALVQILAWRLNRRQAIIWTHDGLGWWRIYCMIFMHRIPCHGMITHVLSYARFEGYTIPIGPYYSVWWNRCLSWNNFVFKIQSCWMKLKWGGGLQCLNYEPIHATTTIQYHFQWKFSGIHSIKTMSLYTICINAVWPSDAGWWLRSRSTMKSWVINDLMSDGNKLLPEPLLSYR